MGNSCSAKRSIDRSNDCGVEGLSGYSKNFCSLAGGIGVVNAVGFCGSIGDNEFVVDFNRKYTCLYNSGDSISRFDSIGCCGWECAIIGNGYDCKRIARRGRPKICCFKDKACKGINKEDVKNICYDSKSGLRSCPLDAQDMDSKTCRDIVTEECSNPTNDPNSPWRANWLTNRTITETANPSNTGGGSTEDLTYTTPTNPICLHALYRNVYGINGPGCNGFSPNGVGINNNLQPPVSSDGFAFGRKMVEDLFTTYIAAGGNIAARVDQESDTEINDLLYRICSTTPGLCTSSLQQICSTVTTADLMANPNYQKWCGCHLNSLQYKNYVDLYGISRECTPTCNQKGVIPRVNEDGITLQKCKQSTCVIDNVSIDLYKSRIGGNGIAFSQICGSCGDGQNNTGTCSCNLLNLTFKAAEASVGGLNVSQQCGSESVCTAEEKTADGRTITKSVPCSADAGYNPFLTNTNNVTNAKNAAEKWRRTKIIILFAVVIIILIVLWFFFSPRNVVEGTKVYPRQRIPPPVTTSPLIG
jgi:hypothetical protein